MMTVTRQRYFLPIFKCVEAGETAGETAHKMYLVCLIHSPTEVWKCKFVVLGPVPFSELNLCALQMKTHMSYHLNSVDSNYELLKDNSTTGENILSPVWKWQNYKTKRDGNGERWRRSLIWGGCSAGVLWLGGGVNNSSFIIVGKVHFKTKMYWCGCSLT